tara:strand:+ start:86 stop:880 length:795 start_codon:yes stop_codon:yes gene_type:complete
MKKLETENFLNIAVEAALASSDIIMNSLADVKIKEYKGKTNLVTKTDIQSEKTIKAIIKSNFPKHNILAEESGDEYNDSNYLWVIDPLDGTTNFVHGYPSFSVSIALYHLNKPVLGVVVEMPNLKMYSAVSGEGAFCEGVPIMCSNTTLIDDCLLVTGFGYDHDIIWKKNMELFKHFTKITHGVRRLGAASIDICHIASGKADGFWEFNLKPWDTAAGVIIAKESGALISKIDGMSFSIYDKSILVANPNVFDIIKQNINSYLN